MKIDNDDRVVLTLDAGGTNFVFTALKRGKPITDQIKKKANAHDLTLCINTLKTGFAELIECLREPAQAISFAFPGPADYPNGIIGDLPNLTAFRGGVPLKAILEEEFNLPVFINNDGDLYAYGEAIGGILPEINRILEEQGSAKRYHNLVGLTLGTGFGAGIVRNGELFTGDNSIAAEVWLLSNRFSPRVNCEELVSTRAIQREYAQKAGIAYPNNLMPFDIYQIAKGIKDGERDAAIDAFRQAGRALGDAIANLMTLTDGIVVIGGGITGAKDLYMPSVLEQLNGTYTLHGNQSMPRTVQKVFNLDSTEDCAEFYKDHSKNIVVPGTSKTVSYDPVPRLAVVTSKMGASEAIALGAYAFATQKL